MLRVVLYQPEIPPNTGNVIVQWQSSMTLRALETNHQTEAAMVAYRDGMAVAERRGDVQAGKEMRVFLRRLQRDQGDL